MNEELLRRIFNVIDMKITLKENIDNFNRIMSYYDQIRVETAGSPGVNIQAMTQRESMGKEIENMQKTINDEINKIVQEFKDD